MYVCNVSNSGLEIAANQIDNTMTTLNPVMVLITPGL